MTLLDFKNIRISAKWCRLKFIECGPECHKKKGCLGKCCDPSSHSNTGLQVHVTPSEARNLRRKYGTLVSRVGLIQPKKGERLCPFKIPNSYECSLHFTDHKPFGCIASPFALNNNDTLIIRHRYLHLPCYDKELGKPAFITFRSSLILLFGEEQTNKLTRYLRGHEDDISLKMDLKTYRKLKGREHSFRKLK